MAARASPGAAAASTWPLEPASMQQGRSKCLLELVRDGRSNPLGLAGALEIGRSSPLGLAGALEIGPRLKEPVPS